MTLDPVTMTALVIGLVAAVLAVWPENLGTIVPKLPATIGLVAAVLAVWPPRRWRR